MGALATYIDHTNLKPDTTSEQIESLCQEAIEYNFHSVCINPYWVPLAVKKLENSPVQVCTVVGFPLGANLTETKVVEAKQTFDFGADEFDMVMNIGAAKDSRWNLIEGEVRQVVEVVQGKCVKVILETCLLTEEEIVKASQACEKAGAHFVKTSTGFSKAGAKLEHVALMRSAVSIGVKASGGIKDKEMALAMIEAGATRIGTSSGLEMVS